MSASLASDQPFHSLKIYRNFYRNSESEWFIVLCLSSKWSNEREGGWKRKKRRRKRRSRMRRMIEEGERIWWKWRRRWRVKEDEDLIPMEGKTSETSFSVPSHELDVTFWVTFEHLNFERDSSKKVHHSIIKIIIIIIFFEGRGGQEISSELNDVNSKYQTSIEGQGEDRNTKILQIQVND